jgi:spore maturation protein CgeB
MNILFIGNFQNGPGGEAADESHLAREMADLGHEVMIIPRDEWREYVIENQPKDKYRVPEDFKPDIILIAKWHHFYDGSFIKVARKKYGVPVFYWVWDCMFHEAFPEWHIAMAREANLLLSGELGFANLYREKGVNFYYFQFDSTDKKFLPMVSNQKEFDVIYTGSCQLNRLPLLKEINKVHPIQVFAYDFEEWRKHGFAAAPAVYGQEFNEIIGKSKIVLGTSDGPNCYGYWSNRVGKVLYAGGFLLQLYTPGMEVIIGDSCEYFSTAEEANYKIDHYLANSAAREQILQNNILSGREKWTSEYKVRQLTILMERYLKGNPELWNLA